MTEDDIRKIAEEEAKKAADAPKVTSLVPNPRVFLPRFIRPPSIQSIPVPLPGQRHGYAGAALLPESTPQILSVTSTRHPLGSVLSGWTRPRSRAKR
jgi:hypothetical protein